ncbi:BRCT domain [Sesbania bispinosa]|nr:BRCT domain [Sesbania bispinosa]
MPVAKAYAFCSSPHSQPSSPPPGDKIKGTNGDEKFQETEIFEDTLVINSPFTETEVENLNLDTEVVEDSEPVENMATGPVCEYEQEVVLDSEDEEMNNTSAVTVSKGFLVGETSPIVINLSMRFLKRLPKSPCEQADSNASTFGKSATGVKGASIDAQSFDDNNHLYPPVRLNHIHSPEPGDSTQAALGFVDQYLSSHDVDLLRGIHDGKITRQKSPHVLSARGPLNLAKKIKARTQNEEKEPFKWVDCDQNDKEAGIFCQKNETSSDFGSRRKTYKRRRQKRDDHLQNQGNCNAGNRYDKLVQVPRMATENNNSLKELDAESSAIRENVNVYSSVAHTEDMFDIGLDTQIAAEAMDALAYAPPPGSHFDDSHQPENAFDVSLSNLNEAHLKNSSYRQSPGLHSVTLKSNKRNVSSCRFSKVTSSSSCKHIDNQESNPVSVKMKRMTKSKSTVEGKIKNNSSSPICSEHVSPEEVCSLGKYLNFQPGAKEPRNWNESRWTRIKDQPNHQTGRNNNVKEKDILRHKRKGNGLVADPVKLGVRTKHFKLPTNSSGVARKSRSNHQFQVSPRVSATSSFSRIDSWVYPKRPRGKRKRANVQINLNAPTALCIDGKESNVYSTRSLEGQDVDKLCFPHTCPPCSASCIVNGRCLLQGNSVQPDSAGDAMKSVNLHDMHPLLLAHVEISSNKSTAQSSSEIPDTVGSSEGLKISNANHAHNEHHKKPCDKNLPKSSLLKELIRLGVPESTPDMIWRDLRHRRDMTCVRVLFSQHLDDSVIKQQKKILARLNISIASSSMEATHFVADKFTRTKNMLETMALGKPVVTHLWLESCGQANCFIDEKNYILRDMKKEKEIGFSMPVSLARARQKPLLKGRRVYITPHIKPDKEVVSSLVTTVHGQVVDESQICSDKNGNILDDLLILSFEDDYAMCHHFLKRGTAVYSPELVLNGIVIQKLELESPTYRNATFDLNHVWLSDSQQ